jgi:outer membrane protein OmpA-like peptidoglycan-associated protein
MKSSFSIAILLVLFSVLGCNLSEKFKTESENSNAAASRSPTVSPTVAAPTPTQTPGAEITETGKNLLAFGAGATVALASSESKAAGEAARNLIDEAESGGWVSAEGQPENQSIVLELPARTTLRTIVFDTNEIDFGKRAAKDIAVEVSDVSASEGFQTILEATLEDQKEGQRFPVKQEIAGRFVRVVARTNHGSTKQIALEEIRGYGEQDAPQPMNNLSGTYQIESYEEIHLKQEGTAVTGCYKYEEGVISGGVEGRTMTLNWTQRGGTKGFAVINFAADGKRFASVWWSGATKSYDSSWKGEKKSDKVGNCAHIPELDGANAAQNQLEKSLTEQGRAVLYGINFDFNSDAIRSESKPTLDKVVALLKEKIDWKMRVEGHTDNIGGDSFNQTLSEKRAAAVVKYLTAAGIDSSRLSSAGMGLASPVAANETEAGRAQNRRVELVKQ